VAFSADGALLVSCGADQTIRLWDVLGGRQLKQISGGEASLYSVAFHPDGQRVVAAGLDKKIYVYDVRTGQLETTLAGHDDYVYRVAFNQRGDRLLSCGYGGKIIVWNMGNREKMFEHSLNRVANFADYSPSSDQIVVAGGDGIAYLVEILATAR
jgi:WD40 repeat protein